VPDPITARTVARLIGARAAATPDAPMLFDEHDRSMTFAGYAEEVERIARVLTARGVGPGDVVAWQLPTRIETVVLMGALARLGATQVPVLPIHRERELRFVLGRTGVRVLCVPSAWRGVDYAAMAEGIRAELGTFEVLVVDPEPTAEPAAIEVAGLPPAPDDGEAVRWLFATSGTTSDPKIARHVDRAAIAAGAGLAASQGFRPGDRYGVAFPFTHIGGLANLTAILTTGYALILLEAFDPPAAVEVFARHGATVVGGGPAFYRAFLEQQRRQPEVPILPALRFMTGGGAPMPPAMHAEVRDEIGGRGCAHGYGMTETCSILAMNHPDDTDAHLTGTVGRVVPGMELRVVRPDGAAAAVGEEGELRVRGAFLMAGYLVAEDPDEPLQGASFDAEGWFRTGDLGAVDADGYVRITGRLKDIVIRKGENISAVELEDLLYAHAAIAAVAVIGLPDDERGELVCAVIVPEPAAEPPDVARLAAFLSARGVMRQKFPERVEIVDELPRNPAGKTLKTELVRRYSA
jgi:acyl-CoA synthetase (AMP-forming)/AMP-acid ligase II